MHCFDVIVDELLRAIHFPVRYKCFFHFVHLKCMISWSITHFIGKNMLNFIRSKMESVLIKVVACLLAVMFFMSFGITDVIRSKFSNEYVLSVNGRKVFAQDFLIARALSGVLQYGDGDPNALVIENVIRDELMADLLFNHFGAVVRDDCYNMYLSKAIRERERNMELLLSLIQSRGVNQNAIKYVVEREVHKRLLKEMMPWYCEDILVKAMRRASAERRDIIVAQVEISAMPEPNEQFSREKLYEYYQAHESEFMTEETRDVTLVLLKKEYLREHIAVSDAEIQRHLAENDDNRTETEIREELLIAKTDEYAKRCSYELMDLLAEGMPAQELQHAVLVHIKNIRRNEKSSSNKSYDADIVEKAFELGEVGKFASFVDAGDELYLVLLDNIHAPRLKTFNMCREKIKKKLIAKAKKQMAYERAIKMAADINAGKKGVARGLRVQALKEVRKVGPNKKYDGFIVLTEDFLNRVFSAPKGKAFVVPWDWGGYNVVKVTKVYYAEAVARESTCKQKLLNGMREDLLHCLLAYHRGNANISINKKKIEKLQAMTRVV